MPICKALVQTFESKGEIMANLKEFFCIRPKECYVKAVAALPYDVYSREEARKEIEREPMTFLKIDRSDALFHSSVSSNDPCVYEKTRELFEEMLKEEVFMNEDVECLYVYELGWASKVQSGIVACISIDDFLNGTVKKHENTRKEKQEDRIKHIEACQAQTGPIFMTYRAKEELNQIVTCVKAGDPIYDFIADDGISHVVWKIEGKDIVERIKAIFKEMNAIYIADGHHRAASAVYVGDMARKKNQISSEIRESDYVMCVLFPHDELNILGYHRVVKDLNGYTEAKFLQQMESHFSIAYWDHKNGEPLQKGTFGMYLSGRWYQIKAKDEVLHHRKSVEALDACILQDYVLEPLLGITDPRTDKRIDFIGGEHAIEELERRVSQDMKVAFYLVPISVEELMQIADHKQLMPPKSTWFEPKLRSGLFIHRI